MPAVFELVPDHPVNCDPTAAALLRLVVTLVISVLTAASIEIKVPAVGAVLAVREVLVWLPRLLKVLTREAHCVAVMVPAVLTVEMALCP